MIKFATFLMNMYNFSKFKKVREDRNFKSQVDYFRQPIRKNGFNIFNI